MIFTLKVLCLHMHMEAIVTFLYCFYKCCGLFLGNGNDFPVAVLGSPSIWSGHHLYTGELLRVKWNKKSDDHRCKTTNIPFASGSQPLCIMSTIREAKANCEPSSKVMASSWTWVQPKYVCNSYISIKFGIILNTYVLSRLPHCNFCWTPCRVPPIFSQHASRKAGLLEKNIIM